MGMVVVVPLLRHGLTDDGIGLQMMIATKTLKAVMSIFRLHRRYHQHRHRRHE